MARENPSNPYTQDPNHTSKDVQMPISKARVLDVHGMPDGNGFHTVRIRVYGDNAPYVAPVLTPMQGSVWVPTEGTDVAVLFDQSDKPWVIGSWYALDRVEEGDAYLPDYEPGDIRIGNESGSEVTVNNDGSIRISTDEYQPVNIDNQTVITYMDTNKDVPGDNTFYTVPFNVAETNNEELFDPSTGAITLRHHGDYNIAATAEFSSAGQNNSYKIAVFVDGVLEKEKTRQSAVNEPLSLDIALHKQFDGGEEIDIRVAQDSGSTKTLDGSSTTNDFTLRRYGI